ncbi:MAG: Hpt domain-containing protein [Clostridiales bacterium]|nr:Hpt domain-containing protein [Clostridiales bacterium]
MRKLTNALIEYVSDIDDVMKRFVDDEDFYIECLVLFFEDDNLEKLKIAIDNRDLNEAFNAAHTIKGISGNLGLTPIFNLASELVEDFRLKKMENALKKYDFINSEYKKVKKIAQI